jgi:hypothetical protein
MMKTAFTHSSKLLVCLLLGFTPALAEVAAFPVEEGFLAIGIDQMNIRREEEGGIDLIYAPEGVYERIAAFDKIMVDQPEIFIDQDSKYRGIKPDNAKAVADLIRMAIIDKVTERGYEVVDQPGPGVLYFRMAVTDLYLKMKMRNYTGYTPAGVVTRLMEDKARDMMSKVDIIELALQVEMQDSETEEVLAAIIIKRGARKDKKAGQKEQRLEFGEFREIVRMYGGQLACRLDNTKKPESEQIDCPDDDALRAAGYLGET